MWCLRVPLSVQQRHFVANALDTLVPDSGCPALCSCPSGISLHTGHRGVWWPESLFWKVNSLRACPFVPRNMLFIWPSASASWKSICQAPNCHTAALSTLWREFHCWIWADCDRARLGYRRRLLRPQPLSTESCNLTEKRSFEVSPWVLRYLGGGREKYGNSRPVIPNWAVGIIQTDPRREEGRTSCFILREPEGYAPARKQQQQVASSSTVSRKGSSVKSLGVIASSQSSY